ncbi:hypothetical protein LINGRAHAP2_LOCUS912, partial [Linum grandiflorum]
MQERAANNRENITSFKSPHIGGSKKLISRGIELLEIETDENIHGIPKVPHRDDALGRALSVEHSGRLRGMGHGFTPTQ